MDNVDAQQLLLNQLLWNEQQNQNNNNNDNDEIDQDMDDDDDDDDVDDHEGDGTLDGGVAKSGSRDGKERSAVSTEMELVSSLLRRL